MNACFFFRKSPTDANADCLIHLPVFESRKWSSWSVWDSFHLNQQKTEELVETASKTLVLTLSVIQLVLSHGRDRLEILASLQKNFKTPNI